MVIPVANAEEADETPSQQNALLRTLIYNRRAIFQIHSVLITRAYSPHC